MNRDELRATQAPLKDRYRDDPSSAVVTLRAAGSLSDGITCSVETGRALAACAGVTLRAVATSMGVDVGDGTVTAEGDVDFRGTLAVDRDAPVGFREIRLSFDVTSTAPQEQLDKLLELTERYCVVWQTISSQPTLTTRLTTTR